MFDSSSTAGIQPGQLMVRRSQCKRKRRWQVDTQDPEEFITEAQGSTGTGRWMNGVKYYRKFKSNGVAAITLPSEYRVQFEGVQEALMKRIIIFKKSKKKIYTKTVYQSDVWVAKRLSY